MSLSGSDVHFYGDELYAALLERKTVPNLRERAPGIDMPSAYAIQSRTVQRRLSAGEHVVGKKVGATSAAVQNMLGLYEPDFGRLLSGMQYTDGDTILLDSLIQPRAEGEVAFVLKRDLPGPGITAIDVLRATDYVVPCFEIVDSRIDNWDIKVFDTIADNASCGVFVLGNDPKDPLEVDLSLVGMAIDVRRSGQKTSELFATGAGAAVKGSPVNSVVWLANTLAELSTPCRAGDVVLSGSLTIMAWVKEPQTITCEFGDLGSCTVTFA
jgi:2-oxopent-4-enoate/cis-2-oxohex-4-enoate hydratase